MWTDNQQTTVVTKDSTERIEVNHPCHKEDTSGTVETSHVYYRIVGERTTSGTDRATNRVVTMNGVRWTKDKEVSIKDYVLPTWTKPYYTTETSFNFLNGVGGDLLFQSKHHTVLP